MSGLSNSTPKLAARFIATDHVPVPVLNRDNKNTAKPHHTFTTTPHSIANNGLSMAITMIMITLKLIDRVSNEGGGRLIYNKFIMTHVLE